MTIRRTLAVALVVLPLAVALIPIAVPPWTWGLVVARIAVAALGAPLAIVALVLGAVALRLARGAPRLRKAVVALSVLAAVVAMLPALGAWRAAGAGARGIAALPGVHTRGDDEEVPGGLFGALRGLPAPPGIEERTLRYAAADGTPLTLRRYRDPRRCPAACPTVVVLYGGAWRSGDARQSAEVDRWLAGRGYTVVALDYRHAPLHRYPAQPDDVRRGLTLLRDSAAAWGADPSRVVLWGRSSGGHLATLTAWAPDVAALPVRVRGVISFYAPFDLARGWLDLPVPDPIGVRGVLGAFVGGSPDARPDEYRRASPKTYVRAGLAPSLLVYAGGDHLVKPAFGRSAAAMLRASGSPVVYVELPWAEHGFDFAHGGPPASAALGVVVRFLRAVS